MTDAELKALLVRVKAQRDGLLTACERACIVLDDPNSASTDEIWDSVVREVRAAIAKARALGNTGTPGQTEQPSPRVHTKTRGPYDPPPDQRCCV